MRKFDFYLIAPNVSEQMGGEAMKALQIFLEMKKLYPQVVQVTHGRNRSELTGRLCLEDVVFIDDDIVAMFLWRSIVFRKLVDIWFGYRAVKLVDILIRRNAGTAGSVIVHQTEPNSPVLPRSTSREGVNVLVRLTEIYTIRKLSDRGSRYRPN